jgi:hypothetical protein
MPRVTLVSSENGDWEGIYVDGRLRHEEHLCSAACVLEALGIKYEDKVIELKSGRLPLKESELPCQ